MSKNIILSKSIRLHRRDIPKVKPYHLLCMIMFILMIKSLIKLIH